MRIQYVPTQISELSPDIRHHAAEAWLLIAQLCNQSPNGTARIHHRQFKSKQYTIAGVSHKGLGIRDWPNVKKAMFRLGLIDCDHIAIEGIKCHTYRLQLVGDEPMKQVVKKSPMSRSAKDRDRGRSKLPAQLKYFTMDDDAAIQLLKTSEAFQPNKTDDPAEQMKRHRNWMKFHVSLSDICSYGFKEYLRRDRSGGRFHSQATNMPSPMVDCVRLRTKGRGSSDPAIKVDVVNCQVALLLAVARVMITDDSGAIEPIQSRQDAREEVLRRVTQCEQTPVELMPAGYRQWLEWHTDGILYEKLASMSHPQLINSEGDFIDSAARKEFKRDLFQVIFGTRNAKWSNPLAKLIKSDQRWLYDMIEYFRRLPNPRKAQKTYKYIPDGCDRRYKTKDIEQLTETERATVKPIKGKSLVLTLQWLESSALLDVGYTAVMDTEGFKAMTIHDAIICPATHEETALEIVDIASEFLDIPLNVSVDQLGGAE